MFFSLALLFADIVAFGELESEPPPVHVSFVNNASPSYDVEFSSNEKILLEQPYSWPRDASSRYNLVSYSIDGGEFTSVSRLPRGTFTIDVPVDSRSIVFSSTVQYPVSIEGVKDYSFSPKSPTNDNWFDEKSEILVTDITSNDSSLLPNEIVGWDGPIIDYYGNSARILVDSPIHLTAYWEISYVFLGFLALIPLAGIVAYVVKRNKGSDTKIVSPQTKNESKPDCDDYESEIMEFLKQKSVEKIDLLITSEIITPERGTRLKESN